MPKAGQVRDRVEDNLDKYAIHIFVDKASAVSWPSNPIACKDKDEVMILVLRDNYRLLGLAS